MNTTKQALAELKRLAATAADTLYRRIELSAAVLQDLDWIAREHGGSDLKAQDALQGEFFRDLGGFISLGKLIAMHRHVAKAKWTELRYDVAAVEAIYDEATASEPKDSPKRIAWKQLAEERADKIDQMERQTAQLAEANGVLREENAELRAKVARLEGRLEILERFSRQPAGV